MGQPSVRCCPEHPAEVNMAGGREHVNPVGLSLCAVSVVDDIVERIENTLHYNISSVIIVAKKRGLIPDIAPHWLKAIVIHFDGRSDFRHPESGRLVYILV